MPLIIRSAADAIASRKTNPNSGWGSRNGDNRVEPIAMPGFELDVSVKPGDRIFTMGSCFARNVEEELMRAGFKVPMRNLLKRPEFHDVPASIVSLFSTPSLYNELAWATGEEKFDEELAILEYGNGKYVDLHAGNNVRPAPRDLVVKRRRALTKAYGRFRQCGLAVITLGLIEVWYDKEAGHYVNAVPPPPIIRRYPDRFELHVLDFAETLDFCERMIRIMLDHGRDDLVILMSVSPVPLTATHVDKDVMIANSYSKSVLRAVAEHIVSQHDRVRYFPSYESVTLSDRQLAWEDDLIHVSKGIVRRNVSRLLTTLVGSPDGEIAWTELQAEMQESGPQQAALLASQVRRGDPLLARRFFDEFGDLAEQSRDFGAEMLRHLGETRQFEELVAFADRTGFACKTSEEAIILARAQLRMLKIEQALQTLVCIPEDEPRGQEYWGLRIVAHIRSGDFEGLDSAFAQMGARKFKGLAWLRAHAANELLQRDDAVRAKLHIRAAAAEAPDSPMTLFVRAFYQFKTGNFDKAANLIAMIDGEDPKVQKRMAVLQEKVDAARKRG